MSLNGEEIYCFIYQNPGDMQMTKGRAPIYDNEIAITEITAEEVGIKMGDTVTVACGSNREEYLVSGIYQGLNDAGLNFSIGFRVHKSSAFHQWDTARISYRSQRKPYRYRNG